MHNDLFEQAVQITKAHGYDILSKQVQELKAENERLKKLAGENDELLEELTESWERELAICHQAGGKIDDFMVVLRQAMEAAFYRTQADSID